MGARLLVTLFTISLWTNLPALHAASSAPAISIQRIGVSRIGEEGLTTVSASADVVGMARNLPKGQRLYALVRRVGNHGELDWEVQDARVQIVGAKWHIRSLRMGEPNDYGAHFEIAVAASRTLPLGVIDRTTLNRNSTWISDSVLVVRRDQSLQSRIWISGIGENEVARGSREAYDVYEKHEVRGGSRNLPEKTRVVIAGKEKWVPVWVWVILQPVDSPDRYVQQVEPVRSGRRPNAVSSDALDSSYYFVQSGPAKAEPGGEWAGARIVLTESLAQFGDHFRVWAVATPRQFRPGSRDTAAWILRDPGQWQNGAVAISPSVLLHRRDAPVGNLRPTLDITQFDDDPVDANGETHDVEDRVDITGTISNIEELKRSDREEMKFITVFACPARGGDQWRAVADSIPVPRSEGEWNVAGARIGKPGWKLSIAAGVLPNPVRAGAVLTDWQRYTVLRTRRSILAQVKYPPSPPPKSRTAVGGARSRP